MVLDRCCSYFPFNFMLELFPVSQSVSLIYMYTSCIALLSCHIVFDSLAFKLSSYFLLFFHTFPGESALIPVGFSWPVYGLSALLPDLSLD